MKVVVVYPPLHWHINCLQKVRNLVDELDNNTLHELTEKLIQLIINILEKQSHIVNRTLNIY